MKIFQIPLFRGIDDSEWEDMKAYGCMRQKHFGKNTIIFHAGNTVTELGIVINGSVNIEHTDLLGNKSILSNISSNHVFAETYALCREPIMVSAVAASDADILFLSCDILTGAHCAKTSWQPKIMRNLLTISTYKNIILSNRIFCTTPKTIRGRLLIYLSTEGSKAGGKAFKIPFDRQGLADYLNVERSALSKELGKMRNEGILEFHKNEFVLHRLPDEEQI